MPCPTEHVRPLRSLVGAIGVAMKAFLRECRCVVMEFCSRGSLDALIHNPDVPMDRMRKLRMAIHTARGMHYLHSRNPAIIHRDLKPYVVALVDPTCSVVAPPLVLILRCLSMQSELAGRREL